MRLLKIINEFSARTVLPVEVDHVVDAIRELGLKDEVYFFDDDKINTNVLRGAITHWEYPMEGWTVRVADIYTAGSLSLEEKRFVQAKELLHLLDHRSDRANTAEEVETLINRMILPPELVDFEADGAHAQSDRFAVLYTLPVLFPLAAREVLLPQYEAGKISLEEIAELVALPKSYVEPVMQPHWAALVARMTEHLMRRSLIPDRITTLDSDQKPIEVISVPLEFDPYVYAKRLEEKIRGRGKPVSAFAIETLAGRRVFTSEELIAYVPRTGLISR